jgi:hypothetical protein
MPGRPSSVSSGAISASMPASTLHPITEVAKPVIACAAVLTHAGDCAVMMTRAARMPKASANVSTILTPLRSMTAAGGANSCPRATFSDVSLLMPICSVRRERPWTQGLCPPGRLWIADL